MDIMRICRKIMLVYLFGVVTSETLKKYIKLEINNRTYFLSQDTADYSDAKTNCSSVGLELILFEDNNEFFRVSQNLLDFVKKSRRGVGIWIDLNVTTFTNGIRISWKNEQLVPGVWSSKEPNENCLNNSNGKCCARIDFSSGTYLADYICHEGKFNYLCAPHYECSDGTHECSHNCIEKVDGYDCGCNSGYLLGNDKRSCEDVDECKNNSHGCEQGCNNTDGSYKTGYKMASKGRSCNDVNECNSVSKRCDQTCTNTNGSYLCSCEAGYDLAEDNKTCVNIDECAPSTSPCQHECTDTEGSFNCSCLDGYILQNDGTSCADVNECNEFPGLFQRACINNNTGSHRCSCVTDYFPAFIESLCVNVSDFIVEHCHETCTNTEGSYFCGCLPGYTEKQGTCEDIDECMSESTHNCPRSCQNENHNCSTDQSEADQVCFNTNGSYNCECPDGFYSHPGSSSCHDINECELKPTTCEHHCNNTIGSFFCTCREGYILQTDGRSCKYKYFNKCPCSCLVERKYTQNIIESMADIIRKDLILNFRNISSYMNTKISAPDVRVTSQAIGYSGLILVSVLLGCAVFTDAATVLILMFSICINPNK